MVKDDTDMELDGIGGSDDSHAAHLFSILLTPPTPSDGDTSSSSIVNVSVGVSPVRDSATSPSPTVTSVGRDSSAPVTLARASPTGIPSAGPLASSEPMVGFMGATSSMSPSDDSAANPVPIYSRLSLLMQPMSLIPIYLL